MLDALAIYQIQDFEADLPYVKSASKSWIQKLFLKLSPVHYLKSWLK